MELRLKIPRERMIRLWIILVLGSLSAFGPLTIDMYLPALPELGEDFHSSASLAQLSLTSCMIGLASGQLIIGPISDVRGRRLPILVGLILYAVSSLACIFANSMWMFIALRFIQGAAGSAGLVISRAVLRDLFSGTELTKFSSKLMLVLGVAPIFAPVAGSQILQFASWKGVFIVLSLIGVAMFIAVYFGLNETLPAQRRSKAGLRNTLRTFGGLMNDRPFMGYAITQGLTLAAMFAYISGSPFILQDIYGMSPQMFSLCFGINGFGLIMASQIAGWLAGLISETAMLVYGLVIASIGGVLLFVMIVAQAGIYFILVPLFIVVSIVGFITTASSSLALQTQAKSAGTASALLGLMSFILGAVVSPLVGLGGGQTAMPLGIVIIASQFSAILCYILLIKRSRKLVPSWIVRESLSRCRTEQADGG